VWKHWNCSGDPFSETSRLSKVGCPWQERKRDKALPGKGGTGKKQWQCLGGKRGKTREERQNGKMDCTRQVCFSQSLGVRTSTVSAREKEGGWVKKPNKRHYLCRAFAKENVGFLLRRKSRPSRGGRDWGNKKRGKRGTDIKSERAWASKQPLDTGGIQSSIRIIQEGGSQTGRQKWVAETRKGEKERRRLFLPR